MVPENPNQQGLPYNRKRGHSEETEPNDEPVLGAQANNFDRPDTPNSALFIPGDHPFPKRAKRPNFNHLRASAMAAQNPYSAFAGPSTIPGLGQVGDIAESIEETPAPDGEPLYMSKAHDMKVKCSHCPKPSLRKAHKTKIKLGSFPFMPGSGARKRMPEHDPENHEIMRLRVDERLAWADIAQVLNENRIAKGKVSSLLPHSSMKECQHPL
jgi:hypothetical protein